MKKIFCIILFSGCVWGAMNLFTTQPQPSDIPKIIHYCWFGKKNLPDYAKQALDSWQKTNPDFHIKRWSEQNFDVHRTPFLSQAYDSKNYAYVSDVCRLTVLDKYGGLYLDTDHILKRDVKPYLTGNLVLTFEATNGISGSFIAATKHHPFIAAMLAYYEHLNSFSPRPIPKVLYDHFKKMYPQIQQSNRFQKINDAVLWPTNVLMINFGGKENAALHLYANGGHNWDSHHLFGYFYAVYKQLFLSDSTIKVEHPDKDGFMDFLIDVPPDDEGYFYGDKQYVTTLYRGKKLLLLFNRQHGIIIRLKHKNAWITPGRKLKAFF